MIFLPDFMYPHITKVFVSRCQMTVFSSFYSKQGPLVVTRLTNHSNQSVVVFLMPSTHDQWYELCATWSSSYVECYGLSARIGADVLLLEGLKGWSHTNADIFFIFMSRFSFNHWKQIAKQAFRPWFWWYAVNSCRLNGCTKVKAKGLGQSWA